MDSLVFLVFPLSLKLHAHQQYLSMYYHRDSQDDPHHPVDPIPREKTRISTRKASLAIDLYFLYEITLAETDCFGKETLLLIRK